MAVACCTAAPCNNSDCLQLTDRESNVCETVCGSPEPVSFSTIRGAVGYHQEVVSRILRRLVNYQAVEKVKGGYRRVSQ